MEQNLQESLAALAKGARKIQGLLRQLTKLEQDSVENAYKMEEIFKKLAEALPEIPAKEFRDQLGEWLDGKRHELAAAKENFHTRFGVELERTVKEKLGIALRGQYPKLLAAFYTIIIDFDRGNASLFYGPEQELLTKAKLTPRQVSIALEKVHKTLTGRKFDSEDFLRKLYDAYRFGLRRAGKSEGDKLPILDVLREFVPLIQDKRYYVDPRKEHFTGYGRSSFSYDLYRLEGRNHGNKRLELTIATRDHTTKREQFLWIPTNDHGEGTTYSYLSFREVDKS